VQVIDVHTVKHRLLIRS